MEDYIADLDDEPLIEQAKLIFDLFYGMDIAQFIEYKLNATEGMLIFGNIFIKNLAQCILTASWRESIRIMALFRNECSTHELLYKAHKAKQNAVLS